MGHRSAQQDQEAHLGFGHQNDLAVSLDEKALTTLHQIGDEPAELFTLHALMFGQQGNQQFLAVAGTRHSPST